MMYISPTGKNNTALPQEKIMYIKYDNEIFNLDKVCIFQIPRMIPYVGYTLIFVNGESREIIKPKDAVDVEMEQVIKLIDKYLKEKLYSSK